jgi:outer membrane protein TolC
LFIIGTVVGLMALPDAVLAQPHARSAPRPGIFDMMTAVDESLAANPGMQAIREEYEAERLRSRQEDVLPPPTLRAQVWQWPISSFNPLRTKGYLFEATQMIPRRDDRQSRVSLAETAAILLSAQVALRAREIINKVKHSYMDLYVARKGREVSTALVPVLSQMAEAGYAGYAAGRTAQHEALQTAITLTKLHQEIVDFNQQARTSEVRLNALMNRPPGGRIGTLDDPTEWRLLAAPETLMRLALERQPRLWAGRATVTRAEHELARVELSGRSGYVLSGGYMIVPGTAGAWIGSIGIVWPRAPWSRSTLSLQRAEYQARLAAARAEYQVEVNEVQSDVYAAWLRVKTAEQHSALFRSTLAPQTRQALEVARLSYQSDQARFSEVVESARALITVQLEYARSLVGFHRALVDLEDAVGQELPGEMFQPIASEPNFSASMSVERND